MSGIPHLDWVIGRLVAWFIIFVYSALLIVLFGLNVQSGYQFTHFFDVALVMSRHCWSVVVFRSEYSCSQFLGFQYVCSSSWQYSFSSAESL